MLRFMRALYAHDHLPFRPRAARAALLGLMRAPRFGRAFVITVAGRPAGYAVLTLSWSPEHLGGDAFVDEIYLDPAFRGRGIGRRALAFMAERCRALGVRALHLEAARGNRRARAVYRRAGFRDHDRVLLTRPIALAPGRRARG